MDVVDSQAAEAARVALERGRPVVLVRPPAPERAPDVWTLLGPSALIVCSDSATALDWADAAPAGTRVHAVTGLTRSTRILKESAGRLPVVAGAAEDLALLLARAALKPDSVTTVVVAWPEGLVASEQTTALDTLLAEARDARRIVLSWQPSLLDDLLERHARRALVVGTPPVDDVGRPLPPVGPARYVVVPRSRRAAALRDVIDALDPKRPLVWSGGPVVPGPPGLESPDAVYCTVLPTRDEFAALAKIAEPVLLVAPAELAYVRSLAAPLAAVRLATAADRAPDRTGAHRERIAQRIARGGLDAELALLEPLLDRFDSAEVAAALLALSREGTPAERAEGGAAGGGAMVRLFVNVGKKDRAAAKDLVGALIREAGLAKGDIGRIELRDTFSLVEVAAGAAEQATRRLTGVTLRGRRVVARLDRSA